MSGSDGYAGALERAKQLVSKFTAPNDANANGSLAGMKRPAQDDNGYANAEKRPMVNDKVAAAAVAAARISQKLGGTGSTEGQSQPQPDRVSTAEIRIPDRLVGLSEFLYVDYLLVIGKKGEQITALQNESQCKVQISPEGGRPERSVSLTGNSQQIDHAKKLIGDIIEKAGGNIVSVPGNMGNMGQSGNGLPPPTGQTVIIEILVPGSKAGLVIGKNGETIKQLQEENNVKMVLIQQSNAPTNEDKPLRISGDASRVEYVKQQVLDIINARERAAGNKGFDGHEATKYAVPAEKAGLVIGKGGETIKEIIRVSGAHVEISKEPSPEESIKIFNIRGSRNEIEVAIRMISERAGIPLSRPGGASNQWGQSYTQATPAPTYNPYTGQPDYSAAWAEYYRRHDMHAYADAILRQAPQPHMGVAAMPTMPGMPGPQAAPAHAAAAQPAAAHYPGMQAHPVVQPQQPGTLPAAPAQAAIPQQAAMAFPGQQQAAAAQYDYNQWWQWQAWQQAWQQQQQPIPQQPVGAPGVQPSVSVPSAMPTAQ